MFKNNNKKNIDIILSSIYNKTMINKTSKIIIFIIYSLIFIQCTQKQEYLRDLQYENPLMYGKDIKILQKHLSSLGFSGFKLPNGYYDIETSEIIRKIKLFLGFELENITEDDFLFHKTSDNVDKQLWEIIFNENYENLLRIISIVSSYDYKELIKNKYSGILYIADGGSKISQWGNKNKIFRTKQYSIKNNIDTDYIYFDEEHYFIIETYYSDNPRTIKYIFLPYNEIRSIRADTYIKYYYQDKNGTYEIKNGILTKVEKHFDYYTPLKF